MRPRWPRGRWNGRRIVGIDVRVCIDITAWTLCWPSIRYGRCLGLGPVRIWYSWSFAHHN